MPFYPPVIQDVWVDVSVDYSVERVAASTRSNKK